MASAVMVPVEFDMAVGTRGNRSVWHFEGFAEVEPQEFVAALQAFVLSTAQPTTSPSGGDNGLGPVSGQGGSGAPGPPRSKGRKFDAQGARDAAAEAV